MHIRVTFSKMTLSLLIYKSNYITFTELAVLDRNPLNIISKLKMVILPKRYTKLSNFTSRIRKFVGFLQ